MWELDMDKVYLWFDTFLERVVNSFKENEKFTSSDILKMEMTLTPKETRYITMVGIDYVIFKFLDNKLYFKIFDENSSEYEIQIMKKVR